MNEWKSSSETRAINEDVWWPSGKTQEAIPKGVREQKYKGEENLVCFLGTESHSFLTEGRVSK